MTINIIGQLQQIGEVQEFGENSFKKREIIIKTVEERPNYFIVEFTQNNIDLIKTFDVGKNIKITCSLRGREYTNDSGKYNVFMSLNGWKIEAV